MLVDLEVEVAVVLVALVLALALVLVGLFLSLEGLRGGKKKVNIYLMCYLFTVFVIIIS